MAPRYLEVAEIDVFPMAMDVCIFNTLEAIGIEQLCLAPKHGRSTAVDAVSNKYYLTQTHIMI